MISSSPSTSSPWSIDLLLRCWQRLAAAVAGGVLLLLVAYLIAESLPALMRIGPLALLTDPSWHPLEGSFALLPMVMASVGIALLAMALALPLGLAIALFLTVYAGRRLRAIYVAMLELLAGIPSVILGFWGLVALVPVIARWQAPGTSLLAAALVLALMITPTIALLSHLVLRQAAQTHALTTAALALSHYAHIFRVVLPVAMPALASTALLALGRALGETMVVLMVAGNVVQFPASLTTPVRSLTANIALEMAYARQEHRSALFVSGLVLLLVAGGLYFLIARLQRGDKEQAPVESAA